jgi:sirohydrochlorin ferrochelatase
MALRSVTVMSQNTGILLIAHGSRQPEANRDLHDLAARLRNRGPHAIVEASFLELAPPEILEAGTACVARGADRVLMIPYFLSAGVHLQRDLTAARDELVARFPNVRFELAPPLGPHRLLDEIVIERITQIESGNLEHGSTAEAVRSSTV